MRKSAWGRRRKYIDQCESDNTSEHLLLFDVGLTDEGHRTHKIIIV